MLRVALVLIVALLLTMSAIGATFVFFVSILTGHVANGLLWLAFGVGAILLAVFMVVRCGATDDGDGE